MGKRSHHKRSELVAAYLDRMKARKYSPKTIRSAGYVLDDFTAYVDGQGCQRVQDVTVELVQGYQQHLIDRPLASSSLEIFMRIVRQFFGFLEDEQRLFINPTADLIVPRRKRPLMHAPSEEDMKKLLAQPNVSTPVGLRDRALMETAYSTGVRREELFALTIFDVDLQQRTLRVLGKNRKERVLPLGRQAVRWLKQYIEHGRPRLLRNNLDEDALWISSRGGAPYSYGALQQLLRKYSLDAGLKIITPHAIRRACATHMLQRGAHLMELKLLLGHSSFKTLSQYLRLSITEIKAMHRRSKPGR